MSRSFVCRVKTAVIVYRSPWWPGRTTTIVADAANNSRCFSGSSFRDNSDYDDPDQFRGPGGLTGRQLFEKVQESVKMDAKYYYADDNTTEDAAMNPSKMSVKELRKVLDIHCVDHSDCLEKSELIQRVEKLQRKYNF